MIDIDPSKKRKTPPTEGYHYKTKTNPKARNMHVANSSRLRAMLNFGLDVRIPFMVLEGV